MKNYTEVNKALWNKRVDGHVNSDFYSVDRWKKHLNSLNKIELSLLGDLQGKKILHLQCHFGQDTLSMQALGAQCTGVDLSNKAIDKAQVLARELNLESRFICCDIYELKNHLDEKFDLVFSSYGCIGWLPDLSKWAEVISNFLKPNGKFVFAEFHPVVWMFNDQFTSVDYSYFNKEAIIESESGSYADPKGDYNNDFVCWNHSIDEVLTALISNGMSLELFQEYDYSPYPCFENIVEQDQKKYQIKNLEGKLPMVFALKMNKNETN